MSTQTVHGEVIPASRGNHEYKDLTRDIDPNLGNCSKVLMSPEFQRQLPQVLPKHVTPERFIQVAQIAAMTNPGLTSANPTSVKMALIQCAKDGLMPDGREAAIVMYGGKAQYQPMIDGVLKRLRLSGEVLNIFAKVVYEADLFDYGVDIDGEYLKHKPDLNSPRDFDRITAAYAVAKLKNGERVIEVMTRDEVDRIMQGSRSAFDPKTGRMKPDSVWAKHYDRMAIKTVLHRICRRLPNASDVAQMLERDIQYETEMHKQKSIAAAEAEVTVNDIQVQAAAINEEQAGIIRNLIRQLGGDEARFCSFMSNRHGAIINSIEQIPATLFTHAVQVLENNISKRMAEAQDQQPAETAETASTQPEQKQTPSREEMIRQLEEGAEQQQPMF